MIDTTDFDGCARACGKKGEHTRVWHECEYGIPPEPIISISRVEDFEDGYPGIVLRNIPLSAWAALITVAKWVSRGKSFALDADPDIASAYPDAAARRALGALHDAGLLDEPAPGTAATQATESVPCPHGCDTSTCPCLACEAEQPDEAATTATEATSAPDSLCEQIATALRTRLAKIHAPGAHLEPEDVVDYIGCTEYDLADAVLAVRDREMGRLRASAETAEQHRGQLQHAIDQVRRFNELVAHGSCRVQAAEQARDTLQILDTALDQTQEQP